MDNYILMNDMVQDHEARMMHLKRYYPFFRLMDTGLSQYRDGSYGRLDMSYIVLAVLRFFIEANHFQDQPVCYEDYRQFMAGLLVRDFDLPKKRPMMNCINTFLINYATRDDHLNWITMTRPPISRKHCECV